MHKPKDFLISRKEESEDSNPAEEAVFTYFGPPNEEDRFRFLVTREQGELISVIPGEGRFKKGLIAWRWDEDEGGEPTSYITIKTTSRRIDLQRMPDKDD